MSDRRGWILIDAHLILQCPNGHTLHLRRWEPTDLARGYYICDRCDRDEVGHGQRWMLPDELRIYPERDEDR